MFSIIFQAPLYQVSRKGIPTTSSHLTTPGPGHHTRVDISTSWLMYLKRNHSKISANILYKPLCLLAVSCKVYTVRAAALSPLLSSSAFRLALQNGSTCRVKACVCTVTQFIPSRSSIPCWQNCLRLEVICSVASGEEEIILNTCNQLINKVDQKVDTISPMILYL